MARIRMVIGVLLMAASVSTHATISKGGVSGGGGDVIVKDPPDHPGTPQQVAALAALSKQKLLNYLRLNQLQLAAGTGFQGVNAVPTPDSSAILWEAETLQVNISQDAPCFTTHGVAVDGSSVEASQGSICISAYSISSKVDLDQVTAQMAALMLHEFSEAAGLTDAEAVALQVDALRDFVHCQE